jgi:hypothetical protein
MWSIFCLYTGLTNGGGYTALQDSVMVKIPNFLICEEYADVHFRYGFSNGNARATVVEY